MISLQVAVYKYMDLLTLYLTIIGSLLQIHKPQKDSQFRHNSIS